MREDADLPAVSGRAPGSALDPSSFRRRRPLFWLTLAFVSGVVLDDAFRPSRTAIGGFCAAAALAMLATLLWPKGKRPAGLLLGTAAVLVAAGGLLRHAQESRFLAADDVACRTPAGPATVWVEGTVCDARRSSSGERAWWVVELDALGSSPEEMSSAAGRIQLGVAGEGVAREVAEGSRVRVFARLEQPASATLPSGFDHAAWLERQGVRRVGVPVGEEIRLLGCAGVRRVDLWLRRLSGQWAARNSERWGAERAALANALILGRREALDPADRQAFRNLGTAHLLSISGLHLHLLAAAVWWALAGLGCSRRRAGWAVILFSIAYAAVAGAQPPVIRAALMIVLYLGGQWLYRAIDPLSVVAATASLIVLHRPGAVFDPGFQLSFMAVLSLIAVYPTLEAAWRSWRRFPEEWVRDPDELWRVKIARWVRHAFFVSWAAWMGTTPAVAWHMGTFSLVAVLANLIVVPLTGAAMLGGLVALLAGPGWIGEVGQVFPTLLLGFNRWASEFAWTGWEVPRPSVWTIAAYAAVWTWVWVGRGRTATLPRLALMLPAAVLALALGGLLFREKVSAPRLTVLDLARGRAALMETPGGSAVLVDGGGEGTGRTISEFLRGEGHRSLVLLVVTEDTPDALGGAVELAERIRIRRAILPRTAAPSRAMRTLMATLARKETPCDLGAPARKLSGPGDLQWTFFDDLAADGKWPGAGSEALGVRVQWTGTSVVFAPVRSSASIRRLLDRGGEDLRCDVLRLYGSARGPWPAETETLIRRSEARTVVAGEGPLRPDESRGLDLAALARERGLLFLAPNREGSLRFADGDSERVLAYRQGAWRKLGP